MNTRQSARISQQQEDPQLSLSKAPPSPSVVSSSHTNLLDQAFMLYSDDDIMSSSLQSSQLSRLSSHLSRHSSYPSLNNFQHQNHNQSILGSLSQSHDESSIHDLHFSQCSDSQVSLIKGLAPLFADKSAFLRRSPRHTIATIHTPNLQKSHGQASSICKNLPHSEMIDDEKPLQNSNIRHNSKIIEQKFQYNPNIFQTISHPSSQLQAPEVPKSYEAGILSRMTRSSKKLIHEETQSSNSNNQRERSVMQESDKNPLEGQESVRKMTKDFIIASRKEKKIKKGQQRRFGLGLKKYGISSKRGFG